MRRTITLLGRGSEGKTTTAHNLAAQLAEMGEKVTVVSTDNFNAHTPTDPDLSLSGLMSGAITDPEQAVIELPEGYGFIPGGDELDELSIKFGSKINGVMVLRDRLRTLDGIVIIDSRAYQPDFWSDSAILVADLVLGVVSPKADSERRLLIMQDHVSQAANVDGINPVWGGFIGTMFASAKIHNGQFVCASINAPQSTAVVMKSLGLHLDCVGVTPFRQGKNQKDLVEAYKSIAGRIYHIWVS